MVMFTEEEIGRLCNIQVSYCLEKFEKYWEEVGDFDLALKRAFPEIEDENEYIDSTSR